MMFRRSDLICEKDRGRSLNELVGWHFGKAGSHSYVLLSRVRSVCRELMHDEELFMSRSEMRGKVNRLLPCKDVAMRMSSFRYRYDRQYTK